MPHCDVYSLKGYYTHLDIGLKMSRNISLKSYQGLMGCTFISGKRVNRLYKGMQHSTLEVPVNKGTVELVWALAKCIVEEKPKKITSLWTRPFIFISMPSEVLVNIITTIN